MIRQCAMILFLFCSGVLVSAQQVSFFENDVLGIAFAPGSTWQCVENASSETLELVNKNHNLHLRMWFEPTGMSVQEYLEALIDREGLSLAADPFTTKVDQHDAMGVIASCSEMRRPVKVLLIAVKNSEGFYTLRFKCPDDCFRDHRYQMQQLISSIIIRNNKESCIFYAETCRNS